MQIPTTEQCYQLMCEMKMLDHIVEHSMQVCRVATFLAHQLNIESGIHLEHDLIKAAALLHDITKTRSIDTGEDHSLTGSEFLTERGYPEVAHLVRQHVRLDRYSDSIASDAEVVNYADKRVLHDRIVSLNKRFKYIVERYGQEPQIRQHIKWRWEKARNMEGVIFKHLPFSPEDIKNSLTNQGDHSINFFEFKKICKQL
jgi:uncharacterized protein